MSKVHERPMGIDVSKATLDLEYVEPQSGQLRRRKLKNTRAGHRQALRICQRQQITLAVMEATGGLERELHVALHAGGVPVALTNPLRARRFAQAQGQLAKTDPIDAGVLWQMGKALELAPTTPAGATQHALQRLNVRRGQLLEMQQMEANRLGQEQNKACVQSLKALLGCLEKQLEQIQQEMDQLVRADPVLEETAQIIDAIPGFARLSALTLICSLPELGRLSRQQIASLAGLACYDCDSGNFQGRRRIHGGRAAVRQALFMPALTAIGKFEPIQQMYQRLCTRPDHAPKQALIACMRKLLVILNARVKQMLTRRAQAAQAASAAATLCPGLG